MHFIVSGGLRFLSFKGAAEGRLVDRHKQQKRVHSQVWKLREKKGSFKSSEFKVADFPKDAGMGPEHKMAAATRQEMKKMGREKKPETSFYFLPPNQQGKQQPQIDTQMMHKQNNKLSTFLTKSQIH